MSLFFTFQINEALNLLSDTQDGSPKALIPVVQVNDWEHLDGQDADQCLGISKDPAGTVVIWPPSMITVLTVKFQGFAIVVMKGISWICMETAVDKR